MSCDTEILNRFFVNIFNRILGYEERAIGNTEVSVNEIHIIEAVINLCESEQNTMTNIAASLDLSAGATSVAVSSLVNKGYLYRETGKNDRRKIFIFPTEKALATEEKHRAFHAHMISAVSNDLSGEELSVLSKSLESLERFFALDR